jgi:eukaryotic-like serine/threonine-protein kinase
VKILDFGVAKFMDASASTEENGRAEIGGESGSANKVGTHVTQTGVSFGTPSYLSPEQIRREKLDARTDLFSFGLVLYEMATGQRAFPGNTATVIRNAVLNLPIVPPRQLDSSLPPNWKNLLPRAWRRIAITDTSRPPS